MIIILNSSEARRTDFFFFARPNSSSGIRAATCIVLIFPVCLIAPQHLLVFSGACACVVQMNLQDCILSRLILEREPESLVCFRLAVGAWEESSEMLQKNN